MTAAEFSNFLMFILIAAVALAAALLVYLFSKLLQKQADDTPCAGCIAGHKVVDGMHINSEGKPYTICFKLDFIRKAGHQ